MAPHSSTLAWKIPWTEEPWCRTKSDTTERLTHRLIVAFLPKRLLISGLHSPSAVSLEPKIIKSVTASIFPPIYLP